MKQRPTGRQSSSEKIIRDIKRRTRKQYNAEEKIRIVLDGLRGEDSIAELCRREGIVQSLYYKWSKDFMEAGNRISAVILSRWNLRIHRCSQPVSALRAYSDSAPVRRQRRYPTPHHNPPQILMSLFIA